MSLVPIRIRWTDPVGLAGADAVGVARCDDGFDYVMKDDSKRAKTMHSEWFCSQLAETIGIAVPVFKVIERSDGTLIFGSRWEGGVAIEPWYEMVKNGKLNFDDVKPTLASVFAFDSFVNNGDRHCNNYIIRSQRTGHGLLCHDYSRAWFFGGFPPPPLPFAAGQNTLVASRWIKANLGSYISAASTQDALDKLESLKDSEASTIIKGHPPSWITVPEEDSIVAWWSSPARKQRLDGIRQGIKDGTYL